MDLFAACSPGHLGSGLGWVNEAPDWSFDAAHQLQVTPRAETDFFRPVDGPARDDACMLGLAVTGDFTLSTHVSVHPVGFGDAAGLMIRSAPDCWAKLCVERGPTSEVAIVSVVTSPVSDDANGELLVRPQAYLRLTRRGALCGMHYSVHGDRWRFVRAFPLAASAAQVHVGVHAQAPFATGCRATFSTLRLTPAGVQDFRSGE